MKLFPLFAAAALTLAAAPAHADTFSRLGVQFTNVEAEGGWGRKPTTASCKKLDAALKADSKLFNQKPVLNAFMACSSRAKGSFVTNETLVAQKGTQARRDCINTLKAQLKDPDSLKVQAHSFTRKGNSLGVKLQYSATNSFGGRISGTFTCKG